MLLTSSVGWGVGGVRGTPPQVAYVPEQGVGYSGDEAEEQQLPYLA